MAIPTYIGWYREHAPVNWDGMIKDPKTGKLVKEPSMTKQEFKAECDINNIIKAYQVTGIISHMNTKAQEGAFIDLPDPIDFQESLAIVANAQMAFAALPSSIRNQFENDPERFLAYVQDPANKEQLITWGLAKDTRPASTTQTTSPTQSTTTQNSTTTNQN